MATLISEHDLRQSVAAALTYISHYHPPDFIRHLAAAWAREESPPARAAMGQILRNARMSAIGRRPMCQDTGVATVFVRLGMEVRIDSRRSLQAIIDDAVRDAYTIADHPLRASMVRDAVFDRRNTGDNSPAIVHVTLVEGDAIEIDVSAKGGGSENKARFTVLNPGESLADWVVDTIAGLGAGWCPPGILGIGAGGAVESPMLLAKQALNLPLDMDQLLARGPQTPAEAMRLEIYHRVNGLGIGAQGLGGLTAVLDVKLCTAPCHAASLPVALVPGCASTRHVRFRLDGRGPAVLTPPDLSLWPELPGDTGPAARRVDLDRLDAAEVAEWRAGQTLLLSGTLLTGRDAAHRRMVERIGRGEPLPFDLRDRAIYYTGPVDPAPGEIIGPAGPTTASRMDGFLDVLLPATGLRVMIGKAERGPQAIAAIARHGAAYLIAVGGAAYLVSQAIRSARVLAWPDLGMEAIHAFTVQDMPVMVGVDSTGTSVHTTGPAAWRAQPRPPVPA